ncbi:MAG: haloacid dehalogenase type II [Albidovulum sp.]|nr:haloacid dehalogenase type II [Albidovulum sp.]MDE0533247.1 haloacid dehalogenase type II [Albidovulum sp.]
MRITQFKALAFDCYGTLIDWETGILNGLEPLTSQLNGRMTRDQILEIHAYYESKQQRLTPNLKYSDLLAVVFRRIAEEWRIPISPVDWANYGNSIKNWPAFPDSPSALQYLEKHYRLYILSNVDVRSFSYSNEKLGVQFDGVYTAEDIGSYKPSDRNFEYLFANLSRHGIDKTEILHVAESLFHDHLPANRHELANCRIFRRRNQKGQGASAGSGVKDIPVFDVSVGSMSELVELHRFQSEK